MGRLRIFQTLKFQVLGFFSLTISSHKVIFLLSHFTISNQGEPSLTFNTLLRNCFSQIHNFIAGKFYLSQNSETQTQFNQVLCHFIKSFTSPPAPSSRSLLSSFCVRPHQNTLHCLYSYQPPGWLALLQEDGDFLYSSRLFFLISHQNHLYKVHSQQYRLFLAFTSIF